MKSTANLLRRGAIAAFLITSLGVAAGPAQIFGSAPHVSACSGWQTVASVSGVNPPPDNADIQFNQCAKQVRVYLGNGRMYVYLWENNGGSSNYYYYGNPGYSTPRGAYCGAKYHVDLYESAGGGGYTKTGATSDRTFNC